MYSFLFQTGQTNALPGHAYCLKVLEQLTEQQPVFSKCCKTIRSWGVRRNEKIACHVTVRGEKAEEIIEKGLNGENVPLELLEVVSERAGTFSVFVNDKVYGKNVFQKLLKKLLGERHVSQKARWSKSVLSPKSYNG